MVIKLANPVELEICWSKIPRSSHDWAPSTAKAGHSGTGAMVASPNNGGFYDTGYTTTSPEMRFLVDIRQPGTYYVWIRAWADSGTDDSAQIGLDDQATTSADKIYPSTQGAWIWTKLTMDAPYTATLNVTTPGVHAVNIWAREDGLYIDKIVLTTNSSYTPSGTGPNESLRGPVYVYDGDGNRVKAVEAGKITAYLGSHYEVEVSGGITTTRSYYYAGSLRVAMRLNADLYYLLGDHLGSTSLSYKAVGDVVQTQSYKAWGENRWPTTSALPTMLRYTGQRAETSLGIYFYNARWYDQWTGRFLQADTVVPGAGNPGAWDRYAGMLNNPLRYIDPTGHTSACAYGNGDPECDANYKDRYTPPDVPLTPGGRWVQDQFLKLKTDKEKWWNADGEFTIEEFMGLWILHEVGWGVDDYVIRALLISQTIAQNLYVGGYNPAYCHTSACFNGAFNFMSAQTGEHSAGGFMNSIQKPGLYKGPGNIEEDAIGPASNFGNRALHPAYLNPEQYGAATQWGNNPALSPDYFRDNNLEQRLIYNGTDSVYYYWSSFFIYSVDQANLWR